MDGFMRLRGRFSASLLRGRKSSLRAKNLTPIDIPFPLKGLYTNTPRDQVPPGYAVTADGVRLTAGRMKRAAGRQKFGDALDGPVVRIDEFTASDGTTTTLAITTKSLYQYIDALANWQQIPKNPAGDLTGAATDLAWAVQLGENFLFSQRKDPVMVFTGGATFEILSADCPASACGVGHEGRLLLGNTLESGNDYRHRVRWNALDLITDWTGTGSGFVDLDDNPDFVTWIEVLSNLIVVLKERRIVLGTRTGQASPAYTFSDRVGSVGTRCGYSVVNLGQEIVYVGPDNIYAFDVNNNKPVGDYIRNAFFDTMNPVYMDQIYGYYVDEYEEVRFATPIGDTTYNNFEWCWNVKDNTWTKRPREIKSVGYYSRQSGYTWDTFPGTWDDAVGAWDDAVILQNYPTTLFGSESGQVYEEDDMLLQEDGVSFDAIYEFGDIVVDPSSQTAVYRVEIRYADIGSTATVYVDFSTDGGNSWDTCTVSLVGSSGNGKIRRAYADKIISGETLTVRFRSAEARQFEIVGIRIWADKTGAALA